MKNKKLTFLSLVYDRFIVTCSHEVALFIACQFALESDFGRSYCATKYHNLCGMKVPVYRPTLCQNKGGFACYIDDYDCINDYLLWLAYNKFNRYDLSHLDVFKKMLVVKGYCPESDYIKRIESIYQQFKN